MKVKLGQMCAAQLDVERPRIRIRSTRLWRRLNIDDIRMAEEDDIVEEPTARWAREAGVGDRGRPLNSNKAPGPQRLLSMVLYRLYGDRMGFLKPLSRKFPKTAGQPMTFSSEYFGRRAWLR